MAEPQIIASLDEAQVKRAADIKTMINIVDLHILNRWQLLRICELEARNNVLDDAVELWRQRAGNNAPLTTRHYCRMRAMTIDETAKEKIDNIISAQFYPRTRLLVEKPVNDWCLENESLKTYKDILRLRAGEWLAANDVD